jgi:hypothetical protein
MLGGMRLLAIGGAIFVLAGAAAGLPAHPDNFCTETAPTLVSLYCWLSHTTSEQVTAAATALLAIITGLLGWLALQQGRTARAQLRAYVFSLRPQITQLKYGFTVEITVPYKNFGQTPAYDVVARSWMAVLPPELPPNFSFEKPPDPKPPMTTILPPGEGYRVRTGSSRPVAHDEVDTIKSAKDLRLYVYGNIDYVDAFGLGRTTEFCYCYDAYAFTSGEVSLCRHHNLAT